MKIMEAIMGRFTLDTSDVTKGMKKATKDVDQGSKKMGMSMSSVASKIGLAGAAMSAMALAAKGLSVLSSFESSMAEVSTIVDTATVNMADLSDEILTMSQNVPQSADDLGAGLYQVFSSGVTDAKDATMLLDVAARAATAGLTTTYKAVDATTTILNAYNLEAKDAADINDVLFETVKQGKINYDDLASGIGEVATPAALAGINIETLGAAIATMTKAGISSSETMTSLNSLIMKMIDPSTGAVKAAKALGIELSASALKSKGLPAILNEIKEAAKGDIEVLQSLVPDIRAFRAASILAGSGSEEFNEQLENMEDVAGNVSKAFEKMNDTIGNQMKLLENNVTALFIKSIIGETATLSGALKDLNFYIQDNSANWVSWSQVLIKSLSLSWTSSKAYLEMIKQGPKGILTYWDTLREGIYQVGVAWGSFNPDPTIDSLKRTKEEVERTAAAFDVLMKVGLPTPDTSKIKESLEEMKIPTPEFAEPDLSGMMEFHEISTGVLEELKAMAYATWDYNTLLGVSNATLDEHKKKFKKTLPEIESLTVKSEGLSRVWEEMKDHAGQASISWQDIEGTLASVISSSSSLKDFGKNLLGAGLSMGASFIPGGSIIRAGIGSIFGFKGGGRPDDIPMAAQGMRIGGIGDGAQLIGVHKNETVNNAAAAQEFDNTFGASGFDQLQRNPVGFFDRNPSGDGGDNISVSVTVNAPSGDGEDIARQVSLVLPGAIAEGKRRGTL